MTVNYAVNFQIFIKNWAVNYIPGYKIVLDSTQNMLTDLLSKQDMQLCRHSKNDFFWHLRKFTDCMIIM